MLFRLTDDDPRPLADHLHQSLEPFRVVFVALFFVSVGMMVDLQFMLENAGLIALLVVLVAAGWLLVPLVAAPAWPQGDGREAHQPADEVLQRWLRRFPGDALVLFARTELMLRLRDWAGAEAHLLELLARRPDDPVVLNNLAFAQQAQGKAQEERTGEQAGEQPPAAEGVV
mgnify:CR=1 FL=1